MTSLQICYTSLPRIPQLELTSIKPTIGDGTRMISTLVFHGVSTKHSLDILKCSLHGQQLKGSHIQTFGIILPYIRGKYHSATMVY